MIPLPPLLFHLKVPATPAASGHALMGEESVEQPSSLTQPSCEIGARKKKLF